MSKIQSQLVKSSTNIKMLVTGFEPFGGEKVNPSEKIVKRLQERISTVSSCTRCYYLSVIKRA